MCLDLVTGAPVWTATNDIYTDLLTGGETQNYGGIRPGCWVNAIVAGGLVLMPEASEGCSCSYLLKTSIALEPAPPSDQRARNKNAP